MSGRATCSTISAGKSGWSPWMLTITSWSEMPISWAASASRSVPVAWSRRVMTTLPPNPSTTRAMRSSSVATTTRLSSGTRWARSTTCWIIGRPPIRASGLPAKRLDW